MAFDSLAGMKIIVSRTQQTFIVGDYFAVYYSDNDTPEVYEWKRVTGYVESADYFTIDFGSQSFEIPKNALVDAESIVRFRTIAEGQLASNATATKRTTPRIVPPKYNYRNSDLSGSTFSASGVYNERDINAGALAYIVGKNAPFTWLVAIAAGVGVFGLLTLIVGELETNLTFFVIIAFFSTVAVAVIIFLIFCMIAKHRYASYVKKDVSAVMNINFVISTDGFAGIEQCVYSGAELIPWHLAKYFYETKYSIVIVCKDRNALRIPKRLFTKTMLREITDFIGARVEQD